MTENINLIRKMGMGSTYGLMAKNMKVTGLMENRTDKENSQINKADQK